MVVNGDVQELPTCSAGTMAAISRNAMANASDAAQFLNVQVEQVARGGMFVAQQGWRRIQGAQPVQPEAAQHPADGSSAEAGRLRDAPPGAALAAQGLDARDPLGGDAARRTMRSGGTVSQAGPPLLLISPHHLRAVLVLTLNAAAAAFNVICRESTL